MSSTKWELERCQIVSSTLFPLFTVLLTIHILQSPHIFKSFWVRVSLALSCPGYKGRLWIQTFPQEALSHPRDPAANRMQGCQPTGLHETILPAMSPETKQQNRGRGLPRSCICAERHSTIMHSYAWASRTFLLLPAPGNPTSHRVRPLTHPAWHWLWYTGMRWPLLLKKHLKAHSL